MAKSEDKAETRATEEEAAVRHLSPDDAQMHPDVPVDGPQANPDLDVEAEAEEVEVDQESIDAAIAAGVNPINIPPEGLGPQGSEPVEDIEPEAEGRKADEGE
jgi:hypothetical protein